MGRFRFDGRYGFLQYTLVRFSPPVQHIDVALNHSNRRAQFMAGIVYKTDLLPVAVVQPFQHIIDGRLQSLQIGIARIQHQLRRASVNMIDSLLQTGKTLLHHIFAGNLLCRQSNLINGFQILPVGFRSIYETQSPPDKCTPAGCKKGCPDKQKKTAQFCRITCS